MNGIDRFFLAEQQQQHQQSNRYYLTTTDDISFSIGNFSDNNLINITNRNENNGSIIDTQRQSELTSILYTIIFGFVCACLCFLTITGNLLVLVTFRRMQTVGNLFILSLATADLIVGCFVMPLAGIYAIMEEWKMGLVLCQIWISVDFTASTASIFNLLTLSLDRYWSITSPLQYLGKRTRTRALFLIGFAWGLSLLWVIPIFGWHRFINHGVRVIEPNKCEPEYTHSKIFKVSTAIINFYLPLLVLMSLNGRIYYEIKRRYKNVLLQRHVTKLNDSITNSNSLYNHKLNNQRNNTPSPITVTLCNSERQLCSTTINCTENDSLVLSKVLLKSPINTNESVLRINFKEKKNRPIVPIQSPDNHRKLSLKRTYSYVDKNHCAQDELTWFAHRREHSHSSFPESSPTILPNYKYTDKHSHRLGVNERCFKHTNEYNSSRNHSNKKPRKHNSRFYQHNHYQTSFVCRHCSLIDSIKSSSTPPSTPSTTTTMNVFNLCHCCSAATSAITIHSNPFLNINKNSNIESYNPKRKISITSSSSVAPSSIKRKQPLPSPISSLNRPTNSTTSSTNQRSNSISQHYQTNKIKQATVWNQQEKAFRQLFAIVFGFTCCFLPYFVLYMVVAFCGSCVSERVVTATIWLGYVNSTINPFLYALSNKHFRRTFNRLLKRDNRRQSYYN